MNLKTNYPFYNKYPKLNFIDKPAHLICGICNEIFTYPHQTMCGCQFCLKCIEGLLEGKKEILCPGKNEDCGEISYYDLSFDIAVNKEVMKLRVECPHESCKVDKTLKEIIDHVGDCEYRIVECTMCNAKYKFIYQTKHDEEECPNRDIECQYCSNKMKPQQYEDHLNPDSDDLCKKYSVNECPYNCSAEGTIGNLREHLKICTKANHKCPLSRSNCSNCKFNEEELKVHFDDNLFKHYSYICGKFKKFEEYKQLNSNVYRKIEKLEKENKELKMNYKNLESQITEIKEQNESTSNNKFKTLIEENKQMKIEHKSLELQVTEIKEQMESMLNKDIKKK